jgi:hypothetical protein
MDPEESPSIPNHDEKQSQGCLVVGFWFWAWLYGYLALLLLLWRSPIVSDDFMKRDGLLVALPMMGLMLAAASFASSRWRTIPLAALIAVNIIGPASIVFLFLTTGSTGNGDFEELKDVLHQVTANVPIPSGWTVEEGEVNFGGRSSLAIADSSPRNNWLFMSVAPIENLDFPDDPEAALRALLDRHVVSKGGHTVTDPAPTTVSGVDGYLFEVEGLVTSHNIQVGAFVAVFYGTQYHYQITAQFNLADRDELNTVWRNALTSVAFVEASSP